MENNFSPGLRILILGDSISLPRLETPYEATWIGKLKKNNPSFDIIDKSERGASTFKLVTAGGGGVDTLEMYSPDLAILQMGITESAPRLFKKQGFEHYFLHRILPDRFRQKYITWVKKRRVRSPEKSDAPPEVFRENISNYCIRAALIDTRVVLMAMAPPSDALKIKSPLFEKVIFLYNNILKDVSLEQEDVSFFNPYSEIALSEEYWLDEIHYNSEIHNEVFLKINRLLDNLIK